MPFQIFKYCHVHGMCMVCTIPLVKYILYYVYIYRDLLNIFQFGNHLKWKRKKTNENEMNEKIFIDLIDWYAS